MKISVLERCPEYLTPSIAMHDVGKGKKRLLCSLS